MTELEKRVKKTQEQILDLINTIGYGGISNYPELGGEILAIAEALAKKPTGVVIDGGAYKGDFLKVAVNVSRLSLPLF